MQRQQPLHPAQTSRAQLQALGADIAEDVTTKCYLGAKDCCLRRAGLNHSKGYVEVTKQTEVQGTLTLTTVLLGQDK